MYSKIVQTQRQEGTVMQLSTADVAEAGLQGEHVTRCIDVETEQGWLA
jgi:hypothetical protein